MDLISQLRKLEEKICDSDESDLMDAIKKRIRSDKKSGKLHAFIIGENEDFYEEKLPYLVYIYSIALFCAFKEASSSLKEIEEPIIDSQREKVNAKEAFCFSPYSKLLLLKKKPPLNTKKGDKKKIASENLYLGKKYPLNMRVNNYSRLYFYKPLKFIVDILQKNIMFCPYAVSINPPTNRLNRNGKADERMKEEKYYKNFEKYGEDNGKRYITQKDIIEMEEYKSIIQIFSPEALDLILTIGGPYANEYFLHQKDITYNNKNIERINRSRKFFLNSYKDFFQLEEEKMQMKLFDCFILETVLNGSFLFGFCNFFSENATNHLIERLMQYSGDANYLKTLRDLYHNMNWIQNSFLKCKLIDEIVFLSYKNSYAYQTKKYEAGKDNIEDWLSNICEFCRNLCEWEADVYIFGISILEKYSKSLRNIEFAGVCAEYEKLFDQQGIYPAIPMKRGERYKKILKEIVIENNNYYCRF